MGRTLDRLKGRRIAAEKLAILFRDRQHALAIHYSCESIYDHPDGRTPRITSIGVRNVGSGQTDSFSIHKVAEQRHIPLSEIVTHYDILETRMLNDFFDYVKTHSNFTWIHWNMRNMVYGFQVIEHRSTVLGGTPQKIEETKKYDLSREFVAIYGDNYIGHPRLKCIIEKNNLMHRDFMTGEQEAKAFENGEYVKLHQSTLRKVDTFCHLISMAAADTLATDATWRDRYGLHPAVIIELAKEHWIYSGLAIVALAFALVRGWHTLFGS